MQVAGLLAPPPSHGILAAVVAEQPAGQLLATGLDAPALREQLQQPALAPRVLRLDPAAPLGYARDLDVLPNTLPPERHLGYAVQWFALALAVLAIAALLTFRTRKPDKTTRGATSNRAPTPTTAHPPGSSGSSSPASWCHARSL